MGAILGRCKSSHALTTASEAKRNCARATERVGRKCGAKPRTEGAAPHRGFADAYLTSACGPPIGCLRTTAATMAWLLSDEVSWITGQILPVDGGFSFVRTIVKPSAAAWIKVRDRFGGRTRALPQFQIEFRLPERPDAEIAVNGDPVSRPNLTHRMVNAVGAGNTELARDKSAVDQHAAAAFDDSARHRYQMRHCRLDGVAHQNFPGPKFQQVLAAADQARGSRGKTRRCGLPNELTGSRRWRTDIRTGSVGAGSAQAMGARVSSCNAAAIRSARSALNRKAPLSRPARRSRSAPVLTARISGLSSRPMRILSSSRSLQLSRARSRKVRASSRRSGPATAKKWCSLSVTEVGLVWDTVIRLSSNIVSLLSGMAAAAAGMGGGLLALPG